mmetsp:Transcript_44582/g.74385  ORF Transcript_44582/g.74385 Transcript_44582/m.74385 type:complete len:163 (+) Transcript_44582:36-524(+)|eukprot:jgi/Bigna1/91290/estExt_fgenesh1_pg.C_950057
MGEALSKEEPLNAKQAAVIARRVGEFFTICADKLEDKPKKKGSSSSGKRTPNPYQVFLKESFAKSSGKGEAFSDRSKAISKKWKGMTEEDRAPYVKRAQELKEEKKEQNKKESAESEKEKTSPPIKTPDSKKKKKRKRDEKGKSTKKKKKKKKKEKNLSEDV